VDRGFGKVHCSSSTLSALINPGGIDRDTIGESGRPLPLPFEDADQLSQPALTPHSEKEQILQRLVSHEASQDELPSLIETIVSNMKAGDIVECLRGSDAQTFIDVIDEACHQAIPSLRNRLVDLFQPSNFC